MSTVVLAGAAVVLVLDRVGDASGGRDTAAIPEQWQDMTVMLPFGFVTLGVVWLVTVWSLAPLRIASEEAARVVPGRAGARIGTDRLPAELSPLVEAVNAALGRLQLAYEGERRFTQNAAHELRTPLAALGLRLQRARSTGAVDWPEIEHDLAQMGRLTGQLLELARKEASLRRDPAVGVERVNLARIAREAASQVLPLVEAAGRTIETALPREASLRGRADDLRDMIRNLLENALSHGRGTIGLGLSGEAGDAPGGLVLTVDDEGEGVPAILRQAVFERFRKGAAAGAGSGLGLAIARTVVEAHGGRIGFVEAATCRVRVELHGAA